MKVKIWSMDNCSFCEQAIAACEEVPTDFTGFEYEVVKLHTDFEPEDFSSHFPYAKTVPQIVVDGEHIGGWDDFRPIIEQYKSYFYGSMS